MDQFTVLSTQYGKLRVRVVIAADERDAERTHRYHHPEASMAVVLPSREST